MNSSIPDALTVSSNTKANNQKAETTVAFAFNRTEVGRVELAIPRYC